MALRDLFKGESLKPDWEFKTDGIVWRLVPASPQLLVGEERDIQRKTVSFFCLDEKSGSPLWQKVAFGEEWWIGIEAVCGGVILLHKFARPDLPEHRGIIAVDLQCGRTLWSSPEYGFCAFRGASLYVTRTGPTGEGIQELDLRAGSFIKELKAGEQMPPAFAEGMPHGMAFPTTVDLGQEDHGVVAQIRRSMPVQSLVGPVEVVEHDTLVIFSFHEHAGVDAHNYARFNTLLHILDRRSGAVVLREILDKEVAACVPDSFFVQEDFLFYVKDRRTITAVRLANRAASNSVF
jgi:Domain of unknown function (DUF4905)